MGELHFGLEPRQHDLAEKPGRKEIAAFVPRAPDVQIHGRGKNDGHALHVPLVNHVEERHGEARLIVHEQREVLDTAQPVRQVRADAPAAGQQHSFLFRKGSGFLRFFLEGRDVLSRRGPQQVRENLEF